jgi:teichuronic acid biosynthesis glycosyltransferase TuaG
VEDLNVKNKQPLVSVITPVYNASRFIAETIQSVQAQTYQNWEMILVDDQSKDNSREIIQEFVNKDPRIRLIVLEKNSGAAVARNTAINNARGKYIAFLDSDDLWLPTKLQKQVQFMEENEIEFSFTNYKIIKENGEHTNQVVEVPKKITYDELLKNTIIGCLTVMLNIEKLGKVQMENIRTRQDFVLWLSILKKGYTAYGLQEVLALYRKVEGSISSNKFKAAKQNWKVYREIEQLPLLKAVWCFAWYAFNAIKKTKR